MREKRKELLGGIGQSKGKKIGGNSSITRGGKTENMREPFILLESGHGGGKKKGDKILKGKNGTTTNPVAEGVDPIGYKCHREFAQKQNSNGRKS